MLKFLRKKDSVLVKLILGSLVLVFVIAFGWDTVRNMATTRPDAPAEVNGIPVNAQKLQFLVDARLEEFRQQMPGEIPANFIEMIRQNIVASLVHTEILLQEAQALGLSVSDEELSAAIRDNEQFKNNGKFDRDFYLEKFSPWYLSTRGVSFESDLRRELTLNKIVDEFQHLLSPSEATLKKAHQIENTKYKFSVIKVRTKPQDIDDVLPKDLEAAKTSEETAKATQKALADKIYTAWKSGSSIDELLKESNLKLRDTQEIDATQFASVFDGKDDVESLRKLLELTQEKPFPETYFDQGAYYYLVKLTEFKPAGEPSEEDLNTLKQAFNNDLSNSLQSAWILDAKARAKIEYAQ